MAIVYSDGEMKRNQMKKIEQYLKGYKCLSGLNFILPINQNKMKTFLSAMLFLAFLVSMSSQSIDKNFGKMIFVFSNILFILNMLIFSTNVTAQQFDSSIEN